MSPELAIQVKRISKRFPIHRHPRDRVLTLLGRANRHKGFAALENVSFAIHKGETVGIVGRNGSGKSTLLQIICGVLAPTEGDVAVTGRVAALLELGSGFNSELSGRENVYINAAILGLSKDETTARFGAIEAFAAIGDFMDQPVKSYSSGMVVRLAFSVAINIDPQILVVDEALAVGDELFQRKCYSRIEEMKAGGATILFVSHASNTIVGLCDRAILLDSGRLLAIGKPKDVIGKYQQLLNAPADKAAVLRQGMLAGTGRPDVADSLIESIPSEIPQTATNDFDPDDPTPVFSPILN